MTQAVTPETRNDPLEPNAESGPPDREEIAEVDHAPPSEDPASSAAAGRASPMRAIVFGALLLLLVLLAYQVISDRITPYTSQATIDTLLVQVAPEVTGQVTSVMVADNQRVKKGQVLFEVDKRSFEIAVHAAQANLAVAIQGAGVSESDIGVAQAVLRKQRAELVANRQLGKIVTDLVNKRALALTNGIRANVDVAKSQADVVRAEAELERARRNLGSAGSNNAKVQQALAALEQARLDLKNAIVVAPADGVVTNLRLAAGQFVSRGQPLLSFIGSGPRWISADMRENQLGHLTRGAHVLVVLDDMPGQVQPGVVDSIGAGITQGGEAPSGQLPEVQAAGGWLREPQRFPVRIVLTPAKNQQRAPALGRSGAQANVIVFTDPNSILNPIGRLRIRIVAWLSFLR